MLIKGTPDKGTICIYVPISQEQSQNALYAWISLIIS